MRRLLCAFTLVACAQPEPARSTTAAIPAPETDTSASTSPSAAGPLASCPKTYALAAAGSCALASAGTLTCTYPDGHCSCSEYSPCSGWAGAYEEARKHPRAEWTCVPRVRPDGCPGDAPPSGSRCTTPAQECTYAPCGGQVLACRGGVWAVERRISGPP